MLDVGQLRKRVEEQMALDRVPGLSIAVLQEGELLFADGFGVGNVETGEPVQSATAFRIGSVTKPMTATALMRLVDEDLIDLDAPVEAYAGWLPLPGVTLRALLSHSSGLEGGFESTAPIDAPLDEFLKFELHARPPASAPGSRVVYSNIGLSVAGYVLEIVCGEPFATALQRLVFAPLGMSSTRVDVAPPESPQTARPHALNDGSVTLEPPRRYHDGFAPAGLAWSTVLDLARFAGMHLAQGTYHGTQLLRPESVAEMHRLQARHSPARQAGFGLSFEVYTSHTGRVMVTHDGSIGGFHCILSLVPSRAAAVVMCCNRTPGFRLPSLPYWTLDSLLGLPVDLWNWTRRIAPTAVS